MAIPGVQQQKDPRIVSRATPTGVTKPQGDRSGAEFGFGEDGYGSLSALVVRATTPTPSSLPANSTSETSSAPATSASASATGVSTPPEAEASAKTTPIKGGVAQPSNDDPLRKAATDFLAYLSGLAGGTTDNFPVSLDDPETLAGFIYSQMKTNDGNVDISDPQFRKLFVGSIYGMKIGKLGSREFATDIALDHVFGDGDGKLNKSDKISLANLKKRVEHFDPLFGAQKSAGGTSFPDFLKATVVISASKSDYKSLEVLSSKLYDPNAINGGVPADFYTRSAKRSNQTRSSVLYSAVVGYSSSGVNGDDEKLQDRLKAFLKELDKPAGSWNAALKELTDDDKKELSRFINTIYADRFVDKLSKEHRLPIEELTGKLGFLKLAYNSTRNLLKLDPILSKYDSTLLGKLEQYAIFEFPNNGVVPGKKSGWDKVGEFFGVKRRITAEDINKATENIGKRETPSNTAPAPD